MTGNGRGEASAAPGKDELLTFKATGRVLQLQDIENEFRLMSEARIADRGARGKPKEPFTPAVAKRIGEKSGTHLIKLVSPRADGDHAVLRITPSGANLLPALLPSVNAPDIPFAKIVFRPLEIDGRSPKSVVDHIRNPDDSPEFNISKFVLGAFETVFGADVLAALRASLLDSSPIPLRLGVGEFPIIFIPSPKGGDLQITPISPATSFMGMKEVADYYFQKQKKGAPPPPRGRWHKQAVSAKPQNISGAIGGARTRFLASMPRIQSSYEAELYRFIRGGGFPRWFEPDVKELILRYADRLDAHQDFNNQDTRRGLDRLADQLIKDARAFIAETLEDAERMAELQGISSESFSASPSPSELLLSLFFGGEEFDRARRVLSGDHFAHREKQRQNGG